MGCGTGPRPEQILQPGGNWRSLQPTRRSGAEPGGCSAASEYVRGRSRTFWQMQPDSEQLGMTGTIGEWRKRLPSARSDTITASRSQQLLRGKGGHDMRDRFSGSMLTVAIAG